MAIKERILKEPLKASGVNNKCLCLNSGLERLLLENL